MYSSRGTNQFAWPGKGTDARERKVAFVSQEQSRRQKMPRVMLALFLLLTGVARIWGTNHKAVWHPQSYLRTAMVSCDLLGDDDGEKNNKTPSCARRSGMWARRVRKRTVEGTVAIGDIASRDSAHTDYRDRDGDDSSKSTLFVVPF